MVRYAEGDNIMIVALDKREDIIDKEIINEFEAKEKKDEVKFIDSNEIINMIKKAPLL